MRLMSRAVVAAVVAGTATVSSMPAAHAELTGPCEATASLMTGTKSDGPITIDAKEVGLDVVTVPLKDTVDWEGSITGVSGPREHSGWVKVDLPWPFGAITVDSWSGTTSSTGNSGSYDWDLPSSLPRGVVLDVTGRHVENGSEVCAGHVRVELEGSALDSPLTWGALGGTVVTGSLFVFAGRPKFKLRRTRSSG